MPETLKLRVKLPPHLGHGSVFCSSKPWRISVDSLHAVQRYS